MGMIEIHVTYLKSSSAREIKLNMLVLFITNMHVNHMYSTTNSSLTNIHYIIADQIIEHHDSH